MMQAQLLTAEPNADATSAPNCLILFEAQLLACDRTGSSLSTSTEGQGTIGRIKGLMEVKGLARRGHEEIAEEDSEEEAYLQEHALDRTSHAVNPVLRARNADGQTMAWGSPSAGLLRPTESRARQVRAVAATHRLSPSRATTSLGAPRSTGKVSVFIVTLNLRP